MKYSLSAKTIALAACVVRLARPSGLAAQTAALDPHAVQPQRPTVATHAGTVAPGWLEVEAGPEADSFRFAVAPLVAKVGLAPRLQLEIQVPIVRPPTEGTTGIGDASVGVKWRFLEAASPVGNLAIFASVKAPTGSTDSGTGTGTTGFNLVFISSQKLGSVEMDLNVGCTRRTGDGTLAPVVATGWAASFGGPAVRRLGWVGELYGFPATSGPAGADSIVAFLGGPTLQVREWLAFDAGVIVPIAGPQPRALYAGVTYNVGRLWR